MPCQTRNEPIVTDLCLLADLAQALKRNTYLDAQVATLTPALGQPSRPCSEAVSGGPAPDTELAQQADSWSLSIAAQSVVLVNGGHPTVALQLDPPTPSAPSTRLAQSSSFSTSLPDAASPPRLNFSIAAFAGGSANSPSSSSSKGLASSIPVGTSSASHVSSSPGANVDVLREAPSSSAVNIPTEVVQPQAAAHPSSSPAAAPEDVLAAECGVNIASAAESPAAAQPSASSSERKATGGGPHHTAAQQAHPPLNPPLPASVQTVPGCKGAHSSSGSAKPAAKGLLSFFGRGRPFLSPGTALAAIFATPKKVAGSLKTGLYGIAYGVAKKTLPDAVFIQLKLLLARSARKALAAEVCPFHMPTCLL